MLICAAAFQLGDGFFETLNFRAGYSDYKHTEFEGDEVGTRFFVEGFEARTELVQSDKNGWRGVIGAQYLTREFNAIGAEAFVPINNVDSWAVFTVQEIDLGEFEVEGALRFEIQTSVRQQMASIANSMLSRVPLVSLTLPEMKS